MSRKIILAGLLCLFITTVFAQKTTISGTVTDNDAGFELIGLSVYVKDTDIGTVTDAFGKYSLSVDQGTQEIVFSYTGYEDVIKTVEAGETPVILDVKMGEAASILDVVTVTGSLVEKKITEETVSIDVISPRFLQERNNTSLSEVVQRLPGVEVIDGQPNIRSGSGYAYGAGSRVAVLVDDQPLLSADISDVKWNFIPIENAQQVEILKGSSSVLYGSSALNGVINVRLARATETPYTYLSMYSGVYGNFKDRSQIWWGDITERPYVIGMYMAHRQKLTPNLGLVMGGNVHFLTGYLKGGDEERARFNFDLRYNPPNNDRLNYGVSGNIMYHKLGNFFIWGNDTTDHYVHIDDPIGGDRYSTFSLDPWLNYFDKANNKHTIRLRYFDVTKLRGSNENALARIGSMEYRFQRKFAKDLNLTVGTQGQYFNATSVLFERDSLGTLSGTRGVTTAIYAQLDKKFFNKLNSTFGVRWENFNIGGESIAALPVFRVGLNYPVSQTDFLRTSFGQGYRVPSLAERFIDDDITDGIHVYPNPELSPESGWTAELGYKKAIQKKNWNGYVDAAFFLMEYNDMVEFVFDLFEPAVLGFGFKSVNISRARIAGTEFSVFGEGTVAGKPSRIWTGYTYSFPGDLEADTTQTNYGTFFSNAAKAFGGIDSAEVSSILKYRSLHTARFDWETDVTNKFTIGVAANYKSFIYNVDEILEARGPWGGLVGQLVPALLRIQEFRDERFGTGDIIFDLRLGYRFSDHHRLSLITNNVLNREYTVRAGKGGPPRLYNVKYQMFF